jgi:hypothetical protein
MDVNAHGVREISATAHHADDVHWIRLVIVGVHNDEEEIQLFIRGTYAEAKVDQYAAAINGVNEPAPSLDVEADEADKVDT